MQEGMAFPVNQFIMEDWHFKKNVGDIFHHKLFRFLTFQICKTFWSCGCYLATLWKRCVAMWLLSGHSVSACLVPVLLALGTVHLGCL